MTTDELREKLRFYRDLGIDEIYVGQAVEQAISSPVSNVHVPPSTIEEGVSVASVALPSLAPEGDTLLKIQQDIGDDCRRCRLCEARSKIVFGSGNEQARLVFVGEGPGADEDAQGFPFVGRAGQLLTARLGLSTLLFPSCLGHFEASTSGLSSGSPNRSEQRLGGVLYRFWYRRLWGRR